MKHFLTLTIMRMRLTMHNKTFMFFGLIMTFGFFFLFESCFAQGNPPSATSFPSS